MNEAHEHTIYRLDHTVQYQVSPCRLLSACSECTSASRALDLVSPSQSGLQPSRASARKWHVFARPGQEALLLSRPFGASVARSIALGLIVGVS